MVEGSALKAEDLDRVRFQVGKRLGRGRSKSLGLLHSLFDGEHLHLGPRTRGLNSN